MVTLLLDSDRLEVVLSPIERALSFHGGNVHIEREVITKAMLTADAWTWLRGTPHPGTYVPGILAMGTWKSESGTDFALVRRRRPSVVIELDGHETFRRLVLTTRHGVDLLKALRLEVSDQPEDVVDIAASVPRRAPRVVRAR